MTRIEAKHQRELILNMFENCKMSSGQLCREINKIIDGLTENITCEGCKYYSDNNDYIDICHECSRYYCHKEDLYREKEVK